MRIYVPSMGHIPRMRLFTWLDRSFPCTVVTHYQDDAKRIKKYFPWVTVVHTRMDMLVNSRNFILEELAKKNEWFIGMDDDIQGLQITCRDIWRMPKIDMVNTNPPKEFENWRQAFRLPILNKNFHAVFEILRQRLENNGAMYGGFSNMENPFFRQRKWSDVSHIRSNTFVMQNTRKVKWAGKCGHDTRMTVEAVYHYGCVAVLNYCYALHKPYVEGGLGPREERNPFLEKQFRYLIKTYPGLVTWTRNKEHIRFIKYSRETVEKWKEKLNENKRQ